MRVAARSCIFTIPIRWIPKKSCSGDLRERKSFILTILSSPQNVLFIFCALNELFFIGLYLLSFSSPLLSPNLREPAQHIEAKASLSTIFANPWSAGALELARANKMDSFWPWVITGISAPVMAAKQFINVVQLVKASKWLVEGDLARRRVSGEAAKAAKGK